MLNLCPLSIILLNASVAVWCKAIAAEAPRTEVFAYVDDTGGVASKPSFLNAALAVTADYAASKGETLDTLKSKGFTTVTSRMRKLVVRDERLPQTPVVTCVGAQIPLGSNNVDAD